MPDVRQQLRTRGVMRRALEDIRSWAEHFPDDPEVAAACSYYARVVDDLRDELAGPARGERLEQLAARLAELRE
jgi:hypothetical protein